MTTEGGGGSRPAADTNTERAGIHSHDLNSTPILSTLPAMASLSFLGLGLAGARPESMLSPEQAFFSAEQASLATELVRELYRVLRVPPGAAAPSPGWAGTRLREGDGEIPPCLACGKPETLGKTVICDSCERSFHTACVRMKPRQAAELDEWVCPGCEAGGVRPRFPLGKRLLPPGLEIGRAQFGHNSCSKAGDEGNAEDDTRAKKGGFGGSETGGNGDGGSAFSASPGMSRKEQPRRPSTAAMAYRDGDRDGDRDRDGNREGDRNSALPSSIALPLEESNADPLNQGKGAFVRSLAMPMVDGDRDSTLATLSFLPKEGNVEPLNQGKGASASFPLVTHTELPRKPPTVAAADGEGDLTPPAIAFPPKEGSASESLYQGTNLKERLRRPKRERDAEEDEPRTVKRVHAEASVSGGSEDIKLRSSSRLKALYSGKDDDIAKEVETCTADQMLSESGNDETAINSSSRRSKGKGVLRKDFHEAKLQFSDEEAEYIQKLRDFIEQLGGFLEDGWYLKIRRRPNGEKEIFYYSHDGQKFRSRKEVARFLGVLDWKKEDLEQRDNATSLLNSRRFIGVQKRVQESEDESDSDEDELQERQKFEVETSDSEDEHFEPDIEVDLPLECMDLRIESLGTIVQHSESHEKNLIWPVGYCSSWHDSITASVFTSEVLDRGSAGPVFRVTRKPCSDFTNLGYMEGSENEERDNSLVMASRLKFDAIYDEDYELGVLLGNLTGPLVAEDCVTDFLNLLFYCEENPCENIRECNLINGEAEGGSKAIKTMKKDADSETDSDFLRQLFAKAEDSECKNFIGEVSVEGPTPIEAWAAMGKKFFAHLQEFSIGSRHLKFGCSHSEMPPLSPGLNLSDILETLGMETLVANEGDNNPLLITLRDWVGQDRFGFDIPVVQKLIARKPKVKVIRPPPPLGDLIGSKILDEGLVGDLLQIWEFLCRFSEILGLKEVPSLQDLEEALCMGMGNSVISPSGGEQMGSDCREEKAKIQNVVRKKSADLLSVSSSSPVGLDSVVLSSIHISLLRILLPELEQKLLGMSDLTLEAKQGKKKDVEPVTSSSKGLTEGLIILNEVTWPEVARRFIVAMLSLNNGVENADLSFQERWKVLKCIQGDGGALCGGLDGSAGIEADAQLLAEAQKRVFHQDSAKGENVPTLENEEEDEVPEASGKPEWMSLLEPVRKLATNVGARIRNCIRDALEKDPPEWAKEMLEWSISKDVYKGNASGPTKRAVLSVLEKAVGLEKPPSPKKPKVKKVQPVLTISPEFIMRRCRAIIRELIASDGVRVFCNMLGGTVLGYYVSEQDGAEVAPTMVSCPLDFRIIDAKLASGAYGVSHESFAADMQQLWNNLNTVFQDKPEMIKVGESLSHQFESLYKEKVLDLVNYIQEQAAKSLEEEDATEENAPVVPEIKEEELLKAHWEWGVCKICGIDKDDDKVLLCDECDAEYHIYCLVPPLSKIPQGNWYCPTCIAGGKGVPSNENIICRRVSRLSRAVSTDEGRALQSLAGAIVEKDYWDLGVSDKIRLLKFLCDKALDSNAITENLDQYMDASLELQQKLYSLYEERKNAALEANTQQIQRIDLGKKPLQSMDGQMNSISNGEEALYKPDAKVLRSRDIDLNCIAGTSDQGLITTEELISGGEKKKSNIGDSGINPGERISLPISEGDQVKEANAVEGVPSQTASELIEMQIDELEMEAMRMAMRREWLGRDLLNRHYWVLGWEGKLPWLVVDESGGFINEWASKLSNGSMVAKPNNTLCESDKKQWMSYESDAGLEQLLEWLRPTSRREQALKESILRWRMSLLKGNGRLSANKEIVQRPLGRPRLITIVPATKAALFLVKRFGPIYWPDGDDGMLGGGRKRVRTKAIGQSEECLFRCECLEIVWPSRCHCQGCHQTFDSIDELHSHGGGDCFSAAAAAAAVVTSDLANTPTPKTNKKKGGDGRSKKPKNALEGTIKLKISKKQAKKFAFMAPDFEEILKVFKLPVSNQDRVRQIGFIAEDTPAFAPTLSFSPIFDPFLTISGKIKARGDHKGARLVEITNLGSIPNVAEDGKRQKQACLKPKDIVVTPCKSAQPETPDTKGETASPNPQSSNGEEGGSTSNCTTPFGSLQPLSGRSLWVLRRLKANLLDMEALLSLDALEPSRTDPDKRRMWRSFVKSAASIFEVLQAEICLERTLKADYLKETWCNWQSLSSTVQSATLSSLALRIFSLDAAIMYKKAMVGFDPNFPGKKSSSGPKKKALEK